MLRALFIDMNSYFASCEQHDRPELRNKPIAVASVESDYTCVIAASYEAKAFGIKTGTPIWEAKKLCRQLQIVLSRPALYIELHHQILLAIDTCIPVNAVLSIDECTCTLMDNEREPSVAAGIAQRIKQAIQERVGVALRCSIGIAPNAYLAKIAADMHKPDGLTIIQQHQLPDVLYQLKLDDFVGIGPRMLRRLNKAGIVSVEQLFVQSDGQLRQVWGSVVGARLFRLIRGEDLPGPIIQRKTVGHSYVLPPDLRTVDGARSVLMRLIHKAAARMRSMRMWAQRLEVDIEIMQAKAWFARVDFVPCQDTHSILEAFEKVWQAPTGTPIRAGVRLSRCTHDAFMPAPLFKEEQRRLSLSRAMDRINLRYGSNAVYYGGIHDARQVAGLRIAFGSIPDPSIPG